ncbi:MAG TPA: pantoate--beta-alanine ligase [Gemmatimonadales bacterium]|nr:pantoate--beta-alanine ligase [Gemmatimonadales bacterium]
MIEIETVAAMRAWSRAARRVGERIAFVPTMGFLHEGHLRLVDRGRRDADRVVLSVFVNPTQFGPIEDFSRYPRDAARDRALAETRGVDAVFMPSTEEMYPRTGVVRVVPGRLADHLCGPFRPGHFEGVLTVVAKLLHAVEPDVAIFGRKDAQQAVMIQRMVADLDFPVIIDVAPIVREADGLALSSRNVYLSDADRTAALALSQALTAAHERFTSGVTDAAEVLQAARAVLSAEPAVRLEYLEAVDPTELQPVDVVDAATLVAVAAYVGRTRLIDNTIVGRGLAADERLDG